MMRHVFDHVIEQRRCFLEFKMGPLECLFVVLSIIFRYYHKQMIVGHIMITQHTWVLFVCCFVHLENFFSLIWKCRKCHHCRWCRPWPLSRVFFVFFVFFVLFFFIVRHPSLRIRKIFTFPRAFGNGALTTCFKELDPSRLAFEHPTFRIQGRAF